MIIVLQLHTRRFFVMRSDETKSESRIMLEAEVLYDYPKKYLPEFIFAKHVEESPIDLDKYVKYYMILFGIDNVRGGSYLNISLPDYQQKTLLEEMSTAANEDVSNLIEYANQPHTKEELAERLATVRANYEKYKKDLQKRIDIDVDYIRKELEWLSNSIPLTDSNTYLCNIEKSANIKRYRLLLRLLKKVTYIIMNVIEKDIDDPFIRYPEFVFDDFVYHHHRTHLPRCNENMKYVLNQYYHLLNIIENRKVEREFDIASWGANAGREMPREIYLLKKMSK